MMPASVYLDAKFAEAERLTALDPPARAVYRRLAVLRTRLAAEVGVKPYHVYTNRQLIELSEKKPADLSGLSAITGFGQKRLVDYGDLILASIKTEVPVTTNGIRPNTLNSLAPSDYSPDRPKRDHQHASS